MKKIISVIIPTLNSGGTIERCINSLLNQSYPREKFEIIVVDGISEDDSVKIAKKAGADDKFTSYIEPGAEHVLSETMWQYVKECFAKHLKTA